MKTDAKWVWVGLLSAGLVGACGGAQSNDSDGDGSGATGGSDSTGATGGVGATSSGTGGIVSIDCSEDRELCDGACVDLNTDPTHCGDCHAACDADAVCADGACQLDCPTGWSVCGQSCVADLDTNPAHCGACDTPCPAAQSCVGGGCACPAPTVLCGDQCVNTEASNDHCGECDSPCTIGTCVAGTCQVGAGGSGGVTGGTGGTTGGTGGLLTGGTGNVGPTCDDPDSVVYGSTVYATQTTVTGSIDGAHTDTCDADGNLVEYSCGVTCDPGIYYPPGIGGNAAALACLPIPNGLVVATTIDCSGRCLDGACVSECPQTGDVIRYESQNGSEWTLRNLTQEQDYVCTITFDRDADGYDCSVGRQGTTTVINALSNADLFCYGAAIGGFGTDDPTNDLIQECSFTCTRPVSAT